MPTMQNVGGSRRWFDDVKMTPSPVRSKQRRRTDNNQKKWFKKVLGGKPALQLGNAKKQPPAGAMRMRRLQGKNKNAQKKGPNFGSIDKPSRVKRENTKGVQWLMESAMRSKLRPDKNPFPEEHMIASDHHAERQRASALAASMAQARAKAKREEQEQRLREEAARRAADAEENRQRMHMQAFINNRVVSERRRAAHETRHRSAGNTTKAIQPKFAGRSEKKKSGNNADVIRTKLNGKLKFGKKVAPSIAAGTGDPYCGQRASIASLEKTMTDLIWLW